jgi:hypothetical protein
MKRFRDYNAVGSADDVFEDEGPAHNHIRKAQRKTKGLQIVFDPKAHK